MIPNPITEDCTVINIPAGIHRLPKPIRVSGRNIRIYGEDGAVLRGTRMIPAESWNYEGENIYSAPCPEPADGLLISGQPYIMARYPKFTDPEEVFGGYAADCTDPSKTADWADPTGGYIHAMHRHLWGGYSYAIDGKNPDDTLRLSGGWQNNRQMGMHESYRFAENIREEMTEPGEWYYDVREKRIRLRLREGDCLTDAEAVVNASFFLLENCESVTLENLTMEYSRRTFMETKEPLLRSDWTIYRGGAVVLRNCNDCTLDRMTLRNIGSNGVFTDGKNRNITVSRSLFSHIGATAVCFVGHPKAVRSPLFEYNETLPLAEIDKTPGPQADCYPAECTVDNCLIEYVGTTEKQATGVQISMAYGITLRDTTICHTSRAGINISEGTFGGHRIEGCDVFDTVRETGDHGSFNSWGRDRFWHVPDLADTDAGALASLDMLAPNVITRSRFRCDHGWDIDLDDGSSNYIITENLCLHGGLKLREGFRRTVKHNIIVNNSVHFHVWYPSSEDVVEENIVFEPYLPVSMPEKWGTSTGKNILHSADASGILPAASLNEIYPHDQGSIALNAGFADPSAGNYVPTHPLLTAFKGFPTEFGVRYEPLRRIADTPVLPAYCSAAAVSGTDNGIRLDGMTGKNIETDGEMSVYGTAEHNGVLVLAVEKNSPADRIGLQPDDVITEICGKTVRNTVTLRNTPAPFSGEVTILRKQQKRILKETSVQ